MQHRQSGRRAVEAQCRCLALVRRAFGLPVTAADDVFLRPLTTAEAAARATRPAAAKATPPLVVVRRAAGTRRA
jgi:hypothetical protein